MIVCYIEILRIDNVRKNYRYFNNKQLVDLFYQATRPRSAEDDDYGKFYRNQDKMKTYYRNAAVPDDFSPKRPADPIL